MSKMVAINSSSVLCITHILGIIFWGINIQIAMEEFIYLFNVFIILICAYKWWFPVMGLGRSCLVSVLLIGLYYVSHIIQIVINIL